MQDQLHKLTRWGLSLPSVCFLCVRVKTKVNTEKQNKLQQKKKKKQKKINHSVQKFCTKQPQNFTVKINCNHSILGLVPLPHFRGAQVRTLYRHC